MKNIYTGLLLPKIKTPIKTNRAMKLTCALLFAASFGVFATGNAQTMRVNIQVDNVSTEKVLSEIEKQTDYLFVYNKKEVDLKRKTSVNAVNKTTAEVLSTIFEGTDIIYAIEGENIMLMRKEQNLAVVPDAVQQDNKITGTVLDATGMPVIGANIMVKGTNVGTITDVDGKFTLDVAENAILQVTYIGFASQEIKVGNQTSLSITMKEDSEMLGEVVVTALGIKREEKALGYAVQKVSGETLNTVKTVDVATGLTGKIAGLNVQNSTEFNNAPTLSLRGETPLLVVDGVPYKNLTLRDIAPDDIESIDVLKGATASALYGARGGSGAVMVTTKRGQKEGLNISVNSSTMFNAGYLRKPEVQTSYSSGTGGKYRVGDYVWGDKMDIGREAEQYNPYTHEWELQPLVSKGKNNLQNLL